MDTPKEPLPLPASDCWATLSVRERDDIIGNLIKAEPIKSYNLYVGGKYFSGLMVRSHEEAEKLAEAGRLRHWKELAKKHGWPDEWRSTLEARTHTNHLRYNETPGGAWFVIEAMREQGWDIEIASTGDGWMITVDDNNPHHGRIIEHGPTMQAAACQAALRLQWPNTPTLARAAQGVDDTTG